MPVLVAVVAVTTVVLVALYGMMFRRDDPVLGLAGLLVAIVAGLGAVVYGGLNSQ